MTDGCTYNLNTGQWAYSWVGPFKYKIQVFRHFIYIQCLRRPSLLQTKKIHQNQFVEKEKNFVDRSYDYNLFFSKLRAPSRLFKQQMLLTNSFNFWPKIKAKNSANIGMKEFQHFNISQVSINISRRKLMGTQFQNQISSKIHSCTIRSL